MPPSNDVKHETELVKKWWPNMPSEIVEDVASLRATGMYVDCYEDHGTVHILRGRRSVHIGGGNSGMRYFSTRVATVPPGRHTVNGDVLHTPNIRDYLDDQKAKDNQSNVPAPPSPTKTQAIKS